MTDVNAFVELRQALPALRHYRCLNSGGVAPTPQATLDLQQAFYDREAVMTTTNPELYAGLHRRAEPPCAARSRR